MARESAGAVAQASASAPALPFRRDDDAGTFPLGGALLLLVLFGVAGWGWMTAWRRRGMTGSAWPWAAARGEASSGEMPRIISTRRLDAATRLHVIEWQHRRLLVASTGSAPPVVLDRAAASGAPS